MLAERVLRVEARIYGEDFEDRNLDEHLLSALHGLICTDLVPEWAGKWRAIEVRVGNLEPPLPHKIPVLMRDYVGGHPKCTTSGHLKVHHFLGVKTDSD
jgi:hypothetical protein